MDPHEEKMWIVNSFGVSTARYSTCWPSVFTPTRRRTRSQDQHQDPQATTTSPSSKVFVDAPLGCHLVRWDVDLGERVRFFRLHGDVVVCMLKTGHGYTFTASEAGEVALWDEDWVLLARAHHSITGGHTKVAHASVSPCGRRIVTSSKHSAGGVVTLFEVLRSEDGELRLVESMVLGEDAHYSFVEWNDASDEHEPKLSSQLLAVRNQPRTSGPKALTAVTSVDEASAEEAPVEVALHLIHIGDAQRAEWSVIKERPLVVALPSGAKAVSAIRVSAIAKEEGDDEATDQEGSAKRSAAHLAIALTGRQVEVVNMYTLDTVWKIDASAGSGCIKCLAFKPNGCLLIPSDNARLTLWHRDELSGEFVLDCMPSGGTINYVNCNSTLSEVWLANESGIHSCPLRKTNCAPSVSSQPASSSVINVRDDREVGGRHVVFHCMTCCGLDFNSEGTQVAVGDFTGNVIVWDINSHHPVAATRVLAPVRSICWRRPSLEAPHILIGCLGGTIFSWNPFRKGDVPFAVSSLNDTVTCMRWQHGDTPQLLAASTTSGDLHIIKLLQEAEGGVAFEQVLAFTAHCPVEGPQNLQFGSIGLFAEIWSLAWSPDNTAIATCSEDQKTIIWSVSGAKLKTLTGHTTAVTGVDWQHMCLSQEEGDREILATCADDQRVMVWDARTWELVHVFDTSHDIPGWHTLTYIALQARGKLLCCVTQHGAVVVWNVATGQQRWASKLHLGSVEGLAWSPASGLIATCSADCTVHVIGHH